MFYYVIFFALAAGAAYAWASKKFGRGGGLQITHWRNAVHQNWALYRRRLLKRTRSQTPPSSSADQVPLIISGDRLLDSDSSSPAESSHIDLRSVTTSTTIGSSATAGSSTHILGSGGGGGDHLRGAVTNLSSIGGGRNEVLSMTADDYRKGSLFLGESIDVEFTLPDLVGQTEILTEEHREKLCGHLPARAEGYSWSLVFSTSLHGFSLNSLYRKMYKLESPILVVIQDTDNNVFGALTSCALHVSDHFYGTGESLLFKFNPSFKVFHWTGENLYFIKGNPESLSIGSGDGKFGLWLDGDLNQGRTQPCSTYGNEPLAPREDFVIKTIECWAFV